MEEELPVFLALSTVRKGSRHILLTDIFKERRWRSSVFFLFKASLLFLAIDPEAVSSIPEGAWVEACFINRCFLGEGRENVWWAARHSPPAWCWSGGMQYVYSMLVKCRYRSVSADRRLDLGELRQVLTPCWLLTKAAVRSALRICWPRHFSPTLLVHLSPSTHIGGVDWCLASQSLCKQKTFC